MFSRNHSGNWQSIAQGAGRLRNGFDLRGGCAIIGYGPQTPQAAVQCSQDRYPSLPLWPDPIRVRPIFRANAHSIEKLPGRAILLMWASNAFRKARASQRNGAQFACRFLNSSRLWHWSARLLVALKTTRNAVSRVQQAAHWLLAPRAVTWLPVRLSAASRVRFAMTCACRAAATTATASIACIIDAARGLCGRVTFDDLSATGAARLGGFCFAVSGDMPRRDWGRG
jgi:hypothetical protein